jgi:hypothetical protein
MILGLSVPAFTLAHVVISLIAIGAGIVVLLGMVNNSRVPGWTALFLLTTALTSISGFFFHSLAFGPPHVFGVITLVVMVPTLLALYAFSLRGWWRLTYVVGALIVLWLNAVVAVIQFFQKFGPLHALAPTGTETPFVATQLVVLAIIVIGGIVAAFRFSRMPRIA